MTIGNAGPGELFSLRRIAPTYQLKEPVEDEVDANDEFVSVVVGAKLRSHASVEGQSSR